MCYQGDFFIFHCQTIPLDPWEDLLATNFLIGADHTFLGRKDKCPKAASSQSSGYWNDWDLHMTASFILSALLEQLHCFLLERGEEKEAENILPSDSLL